MSNTAECLDQSFDKMLEKFTGFMESFTPEEKEIAEKWIEKLKSSDSCVNEMKIRNEIMGYLNQCSAEGKFDAQPFNTIPPTKDPIFVQRWMLV